MPIDPEALRRIADSPEVEAYLKRLADVGRDGAARRAPRDTGKLAEGMQSGSEPGRAWFGDDVDYGIHQEFGTSTQRAQPFLRPAIDDIRAAGG